MGRRKRSITSTSPTAKNRENAEIDSTLSSSEEIIAGNLSTTRRSLRSHGKVEVDESLASGDFARTNKKKKQDLNETLCSSGSSENNKSIDVTTSVFSPPNEDSIGKEEPIDWMCSGVDLNARIIELKQFLQKKNVSLAPEMRVDKNKFRTLHRKMAYMKSVLDMAFNFQKKVYTGWKNRVEWNEIDLERIMKKREEVLKQVDRLREELTMSNSNITESTQLAVKTILDIRADELQTFEGEENISEEYDHYRAVSRLCNVALNSLDELYTMNTLLATQIAEARKKLRDVQKAQAKSASVSVLSKKLSELSTEELRRIAESI